jgi:hypothetical protein
MNVSLTPELEEYIKQDFRFRLIGKPNICRFDRTEDFSVY